MGRTVRLPFCPTAADVVAPEGWHVSRIVDSYEQLPTGQRYDSKTVEIDGDVPVLDQSQEGVLGHHSGDPGVFASLDAPVVTFANHTCAMRVLTTPFSVIQNVFPLIGRPGICDTRFLYYATKGRQSTEEYKGHHPAWRNSYFAYPDLEMQRRIVEILQPFDDLIENNRRRVEILEEMARSIYREWFVKFRYPGHEDVCMINSTLGPIPEDWSVAPLLRVADVRYGRGLAKKEMRPGEIPVYGAAKVIGSHDTATVFERTIVMGCRGSCGQVAITSAPAFVTNNSFTIVPKAGFGKLWLYRFLEHRGVAEFIGGSAQPQITLDSISGLDLYVPNAGLITAFEAAIGPLDAAAWHLGRSSRRLEEIRDQLLPKLVTGQIDVSTLDLDALVSEQVA